MKDGPNQAIFDRLLEERIVFIATPIDDSVATIVLAQLVKLDGSSRDEISLYLNSAGGSVTASLAIYDLMQTVRSPIATYCIGACQGTALLLLAAGKHGRRFVLPHARLAFAEIKGGFKRPEQAEEIVRLSKTVDEAFAVHTGKSVPEIVAARESGRSMSAEEAIRFGLADHVIPEVP